MRQKLGEPRARLCAHGSDAVVQEKKKAAEEIAALTGIPVGTVKSRVSRGRDRLRELMTELLGDGNNPESATSKKVKGGRTHEL